MHSPALKLSIFQGLSFLVKSYFSCSILALLASFWLMLGIAQALFGRNIPEAINFLQAVAVCLALHSIFKTKSRKNRNPLISGLIFLLPSICVATGALITLPQEASAGGYRELELAIKYAKNDEIRHEIVALVRRDMQDGRLSKWEAIAIRRFAFDNNLLLIRADEADTTEKARGQILKAISQ